MRTDTALEVALAVVGIVLVVAILWEVFSDLFQPSGTGALSDWLGRRLFTALKKYPRHLPLAGPIALVTVIGTWVAGLVLGFAFIYYQAYPTDFRTSTGAPPATSPRWSSALYFSFETLVTLGYGDLVPSGAVTRGVATVEALVGFGLLTASVSSIVLLYPALARMHALARAVAHIVAAERETGIALVDSGSDLVLNTLARGIVRARIDLLHFPIVYYFAAKDPNGSIAKWMADLTRFAAEARIASRPIHVRHAGVALDAALHDLAALLDDRFLATHSGNRERIFESFARDHLIGG
jgi:hypothetical protein